MTKSRFKDTGDAFYMERRAFDFFRAFPDVPETLRPAYSRFYDVGLIEIDDLIDSDGKSWPGQLVWSAAGQELRELYEEMFPAKAINFFARSTVLRLLPHGDHTEHLDRIFTSEVPRATLERPNPKGLMWAMAGLEVQLEHLIDGMSTNRRRMRK